MKIRPTGPGGPAPSDVAGAAPAGKAGKAAGTGAASFAEALRGGGAGGAAQDGLIEAIRDASERLRAGEITIGEARERIVDDFRRELLAKAVPAGRADELVGLIRSVIEGDPLIESLLRGE